MDNSEYVKHQADLIRKANLYDNIKEIKLSENKKLESAIEILNDIMDLRNPTMNIRNSTNIKWKEIAIEFYEKMTSGLHIGIDLVRNTYPEWKEKEQYYLLTKLKNMPYVTSRRDGMKVFYFIQKETTFKQTP